MVRLLIGYTKLAKALLDRLDEKETAGEVMFMVAEVTLFVQPMQAVLDLHVQGEQAALSSGDIHCEFCLL